MTPTRDWPVLLISMPFADITRPSIQLGLLKECVAAGGFPVRTRHAGLDLAVRIGAGPYQRLARHRGPQVGEWLFSREAFGTAAPDPDANLLTEFGAELRELCGPETDMRGWLTSVRDQDVPALLDDLVDRLPWTELRVAAFSCTFQQNAASFALARRLKERHPHLVTVFGGANFDGDMGAAWVAAVDSIDYAVSGEGDTAFPALLTALAGGADPLAVPGVVGRADGRVTAAAPAPPVATLDDLPVPDYDEYFTHAEELGLLAPAAHRTVELPFESARGCWWGARHHCTFCGLNGATMTFRAKSAGRVRAELATQARRYRSFRFEAVDNILDARYLSTLVPVLASDGADYDLFYEIKANLARPRLRDLARGGVRRLRPGLESLSSNVLRLMRKGVRAAQNVDLLRWARYYRTEVMWNLLWGFPGETAEDYTRQAAAVSNLLHLQPPASADAIWLERFSPLHAAAEAPRPERSYRYVYPAQVDLDRAAYFFEYDPPLPPAAYEPLRRQASRWQAAWQDGRRPALVSWSAPGFVQIYDARIPGQEATHILDGVPAAVYTACHDRPATLAAIHRRAGADLPEVTVRAILDELAGRGLVFLDEDLAVGLAVPAVPGR